MVSVLKWVAVILLSPLLPVLLLVNSVNAFQLIYVMRFKVANRTTRPVWITPVGTWGTGTKGILIQFAARFPAIPALSGKSRRVKPGGSTRVNFDRKGLKTYAIVVRSEAREYRQLRIDPVPSEGNFNRVGEDRYVIEDWDSLAPVEGDVLAAARGPDVNRRVWGFIRLGAAVAVLYGWVLG
jgi:hypothetical protein